jgi:hypothetical protein
MHWLKKLSIFIALMIVVTSVAAQDGNKKKTVKARSGSDAKELSGISIVGNKEAPKSLFIVPWKSSELGVETGLASSLLNEKLQPVDKEVFNRELDYYEITVGQKP